MTERKTALALLDLLGFSALVRRDFDEAHRVYKRILAAVAQKQADDADWSRRYSARGTTLLTADSSIHADVKISVLSDAAVMTSESAQALLPYVSWFQQAALQEGFLVRGGIASGRHLELGPGQVVSEPLVEAVGLEKKADMPMVVMSESLTELRQPSTWTLELWPGHWVVSPFTFAMDVSACVKGLVQAQRRLEGVAWPERIRAQAKITWFQARLEEHGPRVLDEQNRRRLLIAALMDRSAAKPRPRSTLLTRGPGPQEPGSGS